MSFGVYTELPSNAYDIYRGFALFLLGEPLLTH